MPLICRTQNKLVGQSLINTPAVCPYCGSTNCYGIIDDKEVKKYKNNTITTNTKPKKKIDKWFGHCNTCRKPDQQLMTMVLTFDNKSRLYLVKNCSICNNTLMESYRDTLNDLVPKDRKNKK